MSNHYKSLITDDEVIRELIKESKRREGKLPTEATRLKPNLNFFQRTVSSLVSNNTRIDKSQDTFKTDYLKDYDVDKPEKSDYSSDSLKKSSIDYAFERNIVLNPKINFMKSSETFSSSVGDRTRKKIEIKKINFVRGAGNTSSIRNNGNYIKGTHNKHKNDEEKSGDMKFSESNTSESSVDLILMLNDEKKTTCESFSPKQNETNVIKTTKLNRNDVICISSDDSLIEIASDSLKDKKAKNKVKRSLRKRKNKHKTEQTVEECIMKTKRKKNKKKKTPKITKK